ncbi:MAG: phage tail assembly chaperone [Acidovorax sp.]
MAKLVIGKSTPQSFALKVEVPTPHGLDEVNFDARHLPSTVWAKMREQHADAIGKTVQALFDAARAEAEQAYAAEQQDKPTPAAKKATKKAAATEDAATTDADAKEAAITALIKPVKESDIAALRAKHSAELIVQIVTGWDLDEPLGVDALTDMCDSYPGAAEAVFKAYNETREGLRLGN